MTRFAAIRRAAPIPTGLVFLGVVVLGGGNAVAVGIANREIAPLWEATLRFGVAAVVLVVAVLATRTPWPRGRALTGSVLYGAVGFAGAFGLIHWSLVQAPPAHVQTMLALVPLVTFLLAVAQRLERFRITGLIGALVAFEGIAVIFGEQLGSSTPLTSLAAAIVGAVCLAESNVILKRFPKCHPLANNAVAMAVGTALLLAASVALGESRAAPGNPATVVAIAYAALGGTVVVFMLFIEVVSRWTASAASYVMPLMPLLTILLASVTTGAALTWPFVIGGGLVLTGVYVGAFARRQVGSGASTVAGTSTSRVQSAAQPGCA